MAIIGISGKIGSGKDTVGRIIQYLTSGCPEINVSFKDWDGNTAWNSSLHKWEVKKFAAKLKQTVALLTGCTVEELESQDFKNKELTEEWNWYKKLEKDSEGHVIWVRGNPDENTKRYLTFPDRIRPQTYRELLQRVGTEAMRNQIHENVWVNALFSDYRSEDSFDTKTNETKVRIVPVFPNWIITDTRFPNEAKAIKDRDGILIRVNRPLKQWDRTCLDCKKGFMFEDTKITQGKACPCCGSINYAGVLYQYSDHPSESSLDNHKFDYVIDNNGTIEELIEKVRLILIERKII